MEERIDYFSVHPEAMKGMMELEKFIAKSGLDKKLVHLIKFRASQINGCAYCLDMHSKDARKVGETEKRLYGLSAWRETDYFSPKERAALAWTEAVTLIENGPVSDELYNEMLKHFSEKELVSLNMVVVTINGWNRLAIPFRTKAGDYEPK